MTVLHGVVFIDGAQSSRLILLGRRKGRRVEGKYVLILYEPKICSTKVTDMNSKL